MWKTSCLIYETDENKEIKGESHCNDKKGFVHLLIHQMNGTERDCLQLRIVTKYTRSAQNDVNEDIAKDMDGNTNILTNCKQWLLKKTHLKLASFP